MEESRREREDTERRLQKALGDCVLDSSWMFSIGGALISIPVGIRRKSLAPLIFYGTTGAMLDIIMGITSCEQERDKLRGFVEAKKAEKLAEISPPLERETSADVTAPISDKKEG